MKILFTPNLDWYHSVAWPVLSVVPRKGETVQVHTGSESYCKANDIPLFLEVVSVHYATDHVRVELWYTQNQTAAYDLAGKLNHLYKQ